MTIPVFPERPRVAVPSACRLGEAPIWDTRTATLHWVDVDGAALWWWQPDTDEAAASRPVGERIGFVRLTPDPEILLLGLRSGLARYDRRSGRSEIVLSVEPDRPGNRLNDADVGPDGSLYLGTMDDAEAEPTGTFHRWSEAGLRRFGVTATVTNGPAIDPARRLLYAADTTGRRVLRHRLDAAGHPGAAEEFIAFGRGDGHPDGLTLDAEGHLWVCHFGAGRITRFTPEGRPALDVVMPTAQVTKVAFGGPDLATVYVTTGSRGSDRDVDLHAGHLFAFEPGVRGIAATPCRMPEGIGRVEP